MDKTPPEAGNVFLIDQEPEDDPMTRTDLLALAVLLAISAIGVAAALAVIYSVIFRW